MCTVFYTTNIFEHRVEVLNIFQHRVESTVVFRSSFNIMLELKSVKVIQPLMTIRQALRQLHCLSAPGI